MGKKTFRHVYIICLFHTLNAPLWSYLNQFFSPAIQANFESKLFLFTTQVQRHKQSIHELRLLFSPHFPILSKWGAAASYEDSLALTLYLGK